MASLYGWIETTRLAIAIRDSLHLTAGLSAAHLVGFTLITGSALVANLRLLGVLLPERPAAEIVDPAARGVAVGLAISVTSGLLLFGPRASSAAANGTFQLKMGLLLAAVLYHFTVHRRVARVTPSPVALRLAGAVGLALWTALALAACAFILLE